jgi:O-acetyl-ADP-ribose deacetylase
MDKWTRGHKTFEIVKGDITKQNLACIVNAANRYLAGGGGVDGAVHRAAGPNLMEECRQIKPDKKGVRCALGTAVLTRSWKLPCDHLIHTVGPVWEEGRKDEARHLANAHRSSLELANEHQLTSLAFPAISCGIFRFPVKKAASIAIRTILDHLQGQSSLELVRYVLRTDKDQRIFEAALEKLLRGSDC